MNDYDEEIHFQIPVNCKYKILGFDAKSRDVILDFEYCSTHGSSRRSMSMHEPKSNDYVSRLLYISGD